MLEDSSAEAHVVAEIYLPVVALLYHEFAEPPQPIARRKRPGRVPTK